jgi:hypothetical protein
LTREDTDFLEKLFRSLENEMRAGFAAVDKRFEAVNERLDAQGARLDRVGGLVNGGSRAMARLAEWSEKTDAAPENLTRRVADIEQRLRNLEAGKCNLQAINPPDVSSDALAAGDVAHSYTVYKLVAVSTPNRISFSTSSRTTAYPKTTTRR